MRYEWDKPKNSSNRRKHGGVSLELAALVFAPLVPNVERCLIGPDRVDAKTGEQRWHALGAVRMEGEAGAVLLVVHVYREVDHGEEIIPIISAREAAEHEIRRYQEQDLD